MMYLDLDMFTCMLFCNFQKSFVINPKSKKDILIKAGIAFRNFKNCLRSKHIDPYTDTPECLKFPPSEYPSIDLADWEIFVNQALSDDFQVSVINYFMFESPNMLLNLTCILFVYCRHVEICKKRDANNTNTIIEHHAKVMQI